MTSWRLRRRHSLAVDESVPIIDMIGRLADVSDCSADRSSFLLASNCKSKHLRNVNLETEADTASFAHLLLGVTSSYRHTCTHLCPGANRCSCSFDRRPRAARSTCHATRADVRACRATRDDAMRAHVTAPDACRDSSRC